MSQNNVSPEELEADIARQRDELAATVTELQYRLDVKARASDKVGELKDRATTDSGKPRPDLAIGAALLAAAVIGLVVWRVRSRH
jgi:hypothetical protein